MEETGVSAAERFFNEISRPALVEALLRIIAASREPLVHTGTSRVYANYAIICKRCLLLFWCYFTIRGTRERVGGGELEGDGDPAVQSAAGAHRQVRCALNESNESLFD